MVTTFNKTIYLIILYEEMRVPVLTKYWQGASKARKKAFMESKISMPLELKLLGEEREIR